MNKLLLDLYTALQQAQEVEDEASSIVLTCLINSIKVGHQPILAISVAECTKQKLIPALMELNAASQN